MKYYRGKYVADKSTAITCTTDDGEPYATLSICLADYGMTPLSENQIFVPTYKMCDEDYEMFKRDLFKRELMEVQFGYGKGMLVELRDDWKEICHEY